VELAEDMRFYSQRVEGVEIFLAFTHLQLTSLRADLVTLYQLLFVSPWCWPRRRVGRALGMGLGLGVTVGDVGLSEKWQEDDIINAPAFTQATLIA
jgi:hypothetical protein